MCVCVCVCVCVRARVCVYGWVCVCVRWLSCLDSLVWSGYIWELAGLQVQVTVMENYGIISLGKKLTHNCLSRLRSINEYLIFDWGQAKAPTVTKSISHWGPGETSVAHTTVGIAVGAFASTWPDSRRLLSKSP